MDPLLKVESLSKHFGGFTALNGVSLEIAQGERFGLISPNGSGKTTLINCISGALWNDSGSIRFKAPKSRSFGVSAHPPRHRAQLPDPRPFHSMSLLENLLVPSAYVVHLRESEGEAEAVKILAMMGTRRQGDGARDSSQVELRKLEPRAAAAARPRLLISDEDGRHSPAPRWTRS